MLRRIRNRYHRDVNGYFLCDRGRYGYEFVNSSRRIRQPMLRTESGSPAHPVDRQVALQHAVKTLGNGDRVIGIGSPRASLEANFALRTLVGADHFYRGLWESECWLLDTATALLGEPVEGGRTMSESLRP